MSPFTPQSAVLIVNVHSRKGRRLFFDALDGLEARGIHVVASYPVHKPRHLLEAVQEAIGRGHKLIVVGGGDGTISSVVDFFVDNDIILGLLPLGTGNNFARTLGIPLNLNGALDIISKGKIARVDVGEIGDHHFANAVVVGFPAEVVHNTPRWLKSIFGILAYGITALRQYFTDRFFDCTLVIDGKAQHLKTRQVIIANGTYYGVTKIIPDFHVDNKKLLIFTLDSMHRWQMVKFWIALLTNGKIKFPELRYIETSEVTIDTDPKKHIDVDGEILQKTPTTIKVHPDALQVMVPQNFIDL